MQLIQVQFSKFNTEHIVEFLTSSLSSTITKLITNMTNKHYLLILLALFIIGLVLNAEFGINPEQL